MDKPGSVKLVGRRKQNRALRDWRKGWSEGGLVWRKPIECIEYVVVLELAHFMEPYHDEALVALLDRHLPNWRFLRAELNALPLAEERWV